MLVTFLSVLHSHRSSDTSWFAVMTALFRHSTTAPRLPSQNNIFQHNVMNFWRHTTLLLFFFRSKIFCQMYQSLFFIYSQLHYQHYRNTSKCSVYLLCSLRTKNCHSSSPSPSSQANIHQYTPVSLFCSLHTKDCHSLSSSNIKQQTNVHNHFSVHFFCALWTKACHSLSSSNITL